MSRSIIVFMVVLLSLLYSQQARSAELSSTRNIEPFVDGVMEAAITQGNTVGATVSIVQDGRLVLARGYGHANLGADIPVQSRRTQFRIGSITKVLVWMSVLQQVEAGQLDLDADVNDYLTDFKLSRDFADPITLRHLMTHTAGFEDRVIGLFANGPRQVGVLGDKLRDNMPRRMWLPGVQTAYSNYGAALAAYVVSRVSGLEWHDYVEQNIFAPLGMVDATTRQPVSDAIEQTRARAYVTLNGQFVEKPFAYLPLYPAGSGSATALDIARLMVELLNPRDTGVLSGASKAQLLNGAYKSHPDVNGMTLGMYEMSLGQMRSVGHDGSTITFSSKLVLWPDANMGLFVSTNTDTGQVVTDNLVRTVSKHMGLSVDPRPLQVVEGAEPFVGPYITNRRDFVGPGRLIGLINLAQVEYTRLEEHLTVNDVYGSKRYQSIGDNVFKEVNGDDIVGFTKGIDGGWNLHFSNRPMLTYTPASKMETVAPNLAIICLFILFSLSVLLVWPLSAWRHRGERGSGGQRVVVLLELLVIGFGFAFLLQLAGLAPSVYDFMFHGVEKLNSLLWMPLVVSILVLLQVIYVYRVWAGDYWWVWRRIHFTIVLLVNGLFVWWLWHWHLVPAQARNLIG